MASWAERQTARQMKVNSEQVGPYLKGRRVKERVHRLCDVSSVEVVVIWDVLQVVVLQGEQEPHEGQLAHLKRLEETSFLKREKRGILASGLIHSANRQTLHWEWRWFG
jgi:hypothetical protein